MSIDYEALRPPPMMCGECFHILTPSVETLGGKVVMDPVWHHPVPRLDADHAPVPVPQTGDAIGVCDFCSDDHPVATITTRPVATMELVNARGDTQRYVDDDQWAACKVCTGFLEDGRWDLVTQRAIDRFAYHHLEEMSDVHRFTVRLLHAQVRAGFVSLTADPPT